MTICHFNAYSGMRGDMTVGALVDAGAPAEAIREDARKALIILPFGT